MEEKYIKEILSRIQAMCEYKPETVIKMIAPIFCPKDCLLLPCNNLKCRDCWEQYIKGVTAEERLKGAEDEA